MPDCWLYWIGLDSYRKIYPGFMGSGLGKIKSIPPNLKNPEIQLEIHLKMPQPQPIKGSTIFGLVMIC